MVREHALRSYITPQLLDMIFTPVKWQTRRASSIRNFSGSRLRRLQNTLIGIQIKSGSCTVRETRTRKSNHVQPEASQGSQVSADRKYLKSLTI